MKDDFSPAVNSDQPEVELKELKQTDKAVQFEMRAKIWLPKKVVKFENDRWTVPFWILKNCFK